MTDDTSTTNETIPGGRYLAADGKTFVDANGNEIEAPKPTKAKAAKDGEE